MHVALTVGRNGKIRTVLRTNHIAGFITVPSWKKRNNKLLVSAFVQGRGDNVPEKIFERFTRKIHKDL